MRYWPSLFTKREGGLDEEIQSHLTLAIQDRIDRGETPEKARAAAMLEFGNVPLIKDVTHEMWGWNWLERMAQDLRFAVRQLRKSPGFAITVILTLALGIGANTAIFSLAYAMLLRSLPVERPEQLVQLRVQSANPEEGYYLTSAMYEAMKQRQRVFSDMCAWEGYWFTGEQGGDGRVIGSAEVTGDCFKMLGLHAYAGRLLTLDDDKPDAQAVVISYAWWKTRFQGDRGIIGRKLTLRTPFSKDAPVTIVGVLPSSFQSIQVGDAPSIFVPHREPPDNSQQSVLIFARLRDGVTARQATEQLDPGFGAWNASLPSKEKPDSFKDRSRLEVVPSRSGFSWMGMQYKRPLMLLQALVGVLLLASCAYLGTLMSARSIGRRREIALRAALGASRGRLIRQIFGESALLALMGSALGVVFAWGASHFLMTFIEAGPSPSPLMVGPGRDVLLFTLVISVVAVAFWGLLPALRGSRVAFVSDIKGSGGSLLSGARQKRLGWWLVPTQIALSLLIVVVAGLLSSTLVRLLSQNSGYRLRGSVFASTDFPFQIGKDAATKSKPQLELYRTILERLNHTPGIQSASLNQVHALGGGSYLDVFSATPPTGNPDFKSQSIMNFVGPRYFETLGTHLLKGREFKDDDTATSQPVCVLTRAAERHFFPHADAIGRTLYQDEYKDPAKVMRVIGVVDDMRYNDLRSDAPPIVYMDYTQMEAARPIEFVMKSDDSAAAVTSLRDILATMAPGVHVTDSITMAAQVNQSLSKERLLATLSNFFAGLGLLLGAISLYGILSYSVNCRTAEIGVRIALGASRGNVIRLIVGEAARLVIPGLVVGAVVCAMVTRLLRSLLYETRPLDPLAMLLSVAAILLIALVASSLPARRAARTNPMQALRAE